MPVNVSSVKNKGTKWDEGIADAKKKIKALKYTIEVYRKMKKTGEPWPGESATQNEGTK